MRALKLEKTLYLSLFLVCSVQVGHAAAIKESSNIKSFDKSSPNLIVKALDQQKRNTAMLPSNDDELKMLNTIRTNPTQNFLQANTSVFHVSCKRYSTSYLLNLNMYPLSCLNEA